MQAPAARPAAASRALGNRRADSLTRISSRRALLLLAAAALAALLLQGAITLVVGLRVHSSFTDLHGRIVPAIVADQGLRANVQAMDGDLTNALLQYGLAAPDKTDWRGERSQATKAVLSDLAQNQARIAEPGECEAVAALRDGVPDYSTYAAQAEQAERNAGAAIATGGAAANTPLPEDVVTLYDLAANVVLNRIDPALVAGSANEAAVPTTAQTPVSGCPSSVRPAVSTAGGLYTIHTAQAQRAYDDGRRAIVIGAIAAAVVGLVALALVALAGLSAARQTHRLLAPGMVAGGLLALVVVIGTLVTLLSLSTRLQNVEQQDLSRIETALQLKSVASIANADTSRWLFATDLAQQWQADYTQQAARVGALIQQAGANAPNSTAQQALSGNGAQAVASGCSDGMNASWSRYQALGGQIRAAQNGGQHAQAVALTLGQSDDTFADLIGCASLYQQQAQARFDDGANGGARDALLLAIAATGVAVVGAVLLLLGARSRLADL